MPAQCRPSVWTSERYSAAVVGSMTAAVARYCAEHRFDRVLLVGYSGGGALAALMAPRLPDAVGLVTIAGNLDTDAWTQLHGYLPLTGSLNPALQPPLRGVMQWHFAGALDSNVPPDLAQRYRGEVPPERFLTYPRFDHVCCWRREWPRMFARISLELDPGRAQSTGGDPGGPRRTIR
jgi:pimeloyl-ACP methyl ester carboxylesterase